MDKFIKKIYNNSIKELNEFFGINWKKDKPKIILVLDRKSIDLIRGQKTEAWTVGWVKEGKVFILDRKNFEKESIHKYSDKYYSSLIKHELAHLFTQRFVEVIDKPIYPRWLFEGIAIYLSGQNKMKRDLKKFKDFLQFYKKVTSSLYKESGFAVEFLIKNFGKERFLKLLKISKKIKTKKRFNKEFKRDIKILYK